MKKMCFIVCSLFLVVLVLSCCFSEHKEEKTANEDFLRIHIRANSNAEVDQNVKFVVKDAIVEYLSPFVENLTSIEECKKVVSGKLFEIEMVANKTLAQNNMNYVSKVGLKQEYFPDRSYDALFLKAGSYDALIVELGLGSGNNWWCVVFPPLCFVGGEQNDTGKVEYKSKIAELINNLS